MLLQRLEYAGATAANILGSATRLARGAGALAPGLLPSIAQQVGEQPLHLRLCFYRFHRSNDRFWRTELALSNQLLLDIVEQFGRRDLLGLELSRPRHVAAG